MLFSIIIPIYNVEKYLSECIESVIKQKFDDYEVILVDDGSTDNSGQIADKYAAVNDKIRIIHQNNGGLSAARNTGLNYCVGEYVIFLDSDDFLVDGSLNALSIEIKKYAPDIIAGYGKRFSKDSALQEGVAFRTNLEKITTGRIFYAKALYQNRLTVGAPYYVYNRNYLAKHNFRFMNSLLHEDELWNPIVLYYAERVVDFKFRYYCYRCDNSSSITRDLSKAFQRALDRKKIAEILSEKFKNCNKKDDDAFHDNISAQYMYAVYSGNLVNKIDISRWLPIKEAKSFKYLLKSIIFFISPKLACYFRRMVK